MCCFSGPVQHVSGTSIFARHLGPAQLLAYDMRYAAANDVAMILPLPVPVGSSEHAVRFIDLSAYPQLFGDLHKAFEVPSRSVGSEGAGVLSLGAVERLVVHTVGSFEASFVPSRRDFVRLDPRFRLPDETWDSLPLYADWGFAVFKLKGSHLVVEGSDEDTPVRAGGSRINKGPRGGAPAFKGSTTRVHPMAFEFPTRSPDQIFFPTVHVHDGTVKPKATFDHWLFHQLAPGQPQQLTLAPSARPVHQTVEITRTNGLVAKGSPLYRARLQGPAPNQDFWVPLAHVR